MQHRRWRRQCVCVFAMRVEQLKRTEWLKSPWVWRGVYMRLQLITQCNENTTASSYAYSVALPPPPPTNGLKSDSSYCLEHLLWPQTEIFVAKCVLVKCGSSVQIPQTPVRSLYILHVCLDHIFIEDNQREISPLWILFTRNSKICFPWIRERDWEREGKIDFISNHVAIQCR